LLPPILGDQTYMGNLAYRHGEPVGGFRDAWGVAGGWNDATGHGPGPSG
jgi:hypothetical protein